MTLGRTSAPRYPGNGSYCPDEAAAKQQVSKKEDLAACLHHLSVAARRSGFGEVAEFLAIALLALEDAPGATRTTPRRQ